MIQTHGVSVTDSRCRDADVLQIVNAASKRQQPGHALLLQAYYTKRPLLAIVAACFEGIAILSTSFRTHTFIFLDAKPLDCFMQWLGSKCDSLMTIYSYAVVNVGGFEAFDIAEYCCRENDLIVFRYIRGYCRATERGGMARVAIGICSPSLIYLLTWY